jgi:muramidase (phage lysozyme)
MSPNLKAFLDMIATSEGTKGKGNDGYNVIVGGSLFDSYADHPRKLIWLKPGLASTAAGRYQLLARYWDAYKKQLNLQDFSPESQDAVAIQQIKERKALDDVEKGYIEIAIEKCKNIWASLPGAGYGQHENKIENLVAAYKAAGGTVA